MSPPWGFARVDPLSRHSRTQRTALAAATPKRSAAARRDKPPSTAAITRERKSSDMDFVMPGWPPRPADMVNHTFLQNGTQTIRSEEHTSELQSLMRISYAVFCLKKKK